MRAPHPQQELAGRSGSRMFLLGAAYVLIIIVVLTISGELGVRLLSRAFDAYRSAPFRRYDEQLGVSLVPNVAVIHNRGCFRGEVEVNQWGMRDRERTLDKLPGVWRIALIGDSIVEGVHVRAEEVMNIRMEGLMKEAGHQSVEVLNFGIAGIGTTQQLLLYTERVRHFEPDLVVLLFSDNDVMNNSSTLQPKAYGMHTFYAPYYDLGPRQELVLRPVERRLFNAIRTFLESRSLLVYYVGRIWSRADIAQHTWEGMPIYWGVYGDPPDVEWAQAWKVTERVLSELQRKVRSDGAKLILLQWPSFFDIDPDWRQRLEEEIGVIPTELSPASFSARLEAIARRNRIPFDMIAPYMRRYRSEHGVEWPYFSLECDPHPSQLGHRVGAEAIVERLALHGLLGDVSGQSVKEKALASDDQPSASAE